MSIRLVSGLAMALGAYSGGVFTLRVRVKAERLIICRIDGTPERKPHSPGMSVSCAGLLKQGTDQRELCFRGMVCHRHSAMSNILPLTDRYGIHFISIGVPTDILGIEEVRWRVMQERAVRMSALSLLGNVFVSAVHSAVWCELRDLNPHVHQDSRF